MISVFTIYHNELFWLICRYNLLMKRFILLLLLVPSLAAAVEVIQFKNLSITVISEEQVEVYLGEEHKFSVDCINMSCQVFLVTHPTPEYDFSDGVITPISGLLPLSTENLKSWKARNLNHGEIEFLVKNSNYSSTWSRTSRFKINTENGAYYVYTTEWDWMRYGSSVPAN